MPRALFAPANTFIYWRFPKRCNRVTCAFFPEHGLETMMRPGTEMLPATILLLSGARIEKRYACNKCAREQVYGAGIKTPTLKSYALGPCFGKIYDSQAKMQEGLWCQKYRFHGLR